MMGWFKASFQLNAVFLVCCLEREFGAEVRSRNRDCCDGLVMSALAAKGEITGAMCMLLVLRSHSARPLCGRDSRVMLTVIPKADRDPAGAAGSHHTSCAFRV